MSRTTCSNGYGAPPFAAYACAMIFLSKGQSAASLLVFRAAWRATPIMRIHRSTLSRRSILFLFVLLGAPISARCDALEDSARELARKIAANLTSAGEMSCDIRNQSSLELDDVVRIKQILTAALPGRCVRTEANGSETANLFVVLSENVKNLVWSAEIHQGTSSRDVFLLVPHPFSPLNSDKPLPITLRKEKFWYGPERILDLAPLKSASGDSLNVLLLWDAVLVRNLKNNSETRIEVPQLMPVSTLRDPSGRIWQEVGNRIVVSHERRICTISLETFALVQCVDDQGEVYAQGVAPGKGGQVLGITTACTTGKDATWLVSGTGDDTQTDFLQAVVSQGADSYMGSKPESFPGPILAIHNQPESTLTVIARNLRTGNYEAYHLFISCMQ